MKVPYLYKLKVSFATKISESQLSEARKNIESTLPGYRMYLKRIISGTDSLSIEICTPATDGKGVMSILLSLAAEYIRLQYGSDVKYSKWVLDPKTEPDTDDDNFVDFSGKILSKFGFIKRKIATRDNIGLIALPEGMEPFVKSIVCG